MRTRDRAQAKDELAAALGGRLALDRFTVESFRPSAATRPAFDAASSFDPAKDNLYFYGPTGTGKSHLAIAAVRRWAGPRGRGIAVLKPQELSRRARSCESAAQEGEFIASMAALTCLVLEDLGSEKQTDFLRSLLYEVVDRRYMAMSGGLIVTSNLAPGDLAASLGDERVTSRLAEMCRGRFFSFRAEPDHRLPPAGVSMRRS